MAIQLTQEIIDNLFGLYKQCTGCVEDIYPRLESVLQTFAECGRFEYRAGSKWSGHSKFIIEPDGVCFESNYFPTGKREMEQIRKAKVLFEDRVKEYFESLKKV